MEASSGTPTRPPPPPPPSPANPQPPRWHQHPDAPAKKPGRPRKSQAQVPAASWDLHTTELLLELRYKKLRDRFLNGKSNVLLKAAWIALTTELALRTDRQFTWRQCEDKVRA